MVIAKVEINGELLEFAFETEADGTAAMELLAGACFLGDVDMEAECAGTFISTADAEEFLMENRNANRLARQGVLRPSNYSDRFLFREWCIEGTYLLSGEDAGER